MTHICVKNLENHWLWRWRVACSTPSHWLLIGSMFADVRLDPWKQIQNQIFSFKIFFQMSSAKCKPICLGLNVFGDATHVFSGSFIGTIIRLFWCQWIDFKIWVNKSYGNVWDDNFGIYYISDCCRIRNAVISLWTWLRVEAKCSYYTDGRQNNPYCVTCPMAVIIPLAMATFTNMV